MSDPEDHDFSEGDGFDDPYEAFDLDPPELDVDPDKVDPVDSRVVTDLLDQQNVSNDDIDVNQLVDVGLNYMQINRYEQAADTFERAAQYAPDDSKLEQEAWVNKGVAHSELEEWDEAIGAYREGIHIDEDSEAQRASNASGQRSRERSDREQEARSQASEHAATAETNLAYALWESGRSEQALEHAERAVEIDERFAEAWFNRGFFLLERGLAEDALNSIENAIRLGLRNSEVLDEKARALEELGEYDEAEEIVEEAEQLREQAEQDLIDSQQDR